MIYDSVMHCPCLQVLLDSCGTIMTVQRHVEGDSSALQVAVACDLPDASTGTASCEYDGGGFIDELEGWFSEEQNVTALVTVSVTYGGAEIATSDTHHVILAQQVAHGPRMEAGLLMTLPLSPRFAGDMITCQVTAHTGGFAMSAVGFTMYYDTTALQYAGFEGAAAFLTPTLSDHTEGRLGVLFSGLAAGVDASTVTGDDVALATVSLHVRDDAVDGLYSTAVSAVVIEMVSMEMVTIPGTVDVPAEIRDERAADVEGDARYKGQLTLESPRVVGLYAYLGRAELFNTAPLDGADVRTTVTALRVLNRFGTPDEAVASTEAVCSVSLLEVADAEAAPSDTEGIACEVVLQSERHTKGASTVTLSVTDGLSGYAAAVPVRVWFPEAVAVELADTELNAIARAWAEGCVTARYQSSAVTAAARFGGEGLEAAASDMDSWLDVTCSVAFEVGDPAVASVEGALVRGLAPGATTVYISGLSSSVAESIAEVRVSSDEVAAHLDVALLTGLAWDAVPAVVADEGGAGEALEGAVTLLQELTAEGRSGPIFVYAAYTDGATELISRGGSGMNVTVSVAAGFAHALVVEPASLPNDAAAAYSFRGAVPAEAESADGDLLQTFWVEPCTSLEIASGHGHVTVQLAAPVSATVIAAVSKVAHNADPAAASPVSLATASALVVTLKYEDGSERDFTYDKRTVLDVVTGTHAIRVAVDADTGPYAEAVADGARGVGTVRATFPEYAAASGLVAYVEVEVVAMEGVSLSSSPHPAFTGSHTVSETRLGWILCSGVFQRAALQLIATLSDGQTRDVTSEADFAVTPVAASIAGSSVGLSVVEGNIVVPSILGTYSITGSFSGAESAALEVIVEDTVVAASEVEHATEWSSGGALRGLPGTSQPLVVVMRFTDGTELTDAVSGAQATWLPPSDLLAFTSDAPDRLEVSNSGSVTLLANHYDAVLLTATAVCSDPALVDAAHPLPSSGDAVFCNLVASAGDVDLGAEDGVQFAPAAIGMRLEVPVRLQAQGTLNVFAVTVTANPAHLAAVECRVGTDWAAYSFTCTLNDPPGEVLLAGVELESPVSGLAHLGTVTFEVLGGFVTTPIGGVVHALGTSTTHENTAYPLVAGDGSLLLQLETRRRGLLSLATTLSKETAYLVDCYQRREVSRIRHQHSRALRQEAGDPVLGDVNADGVFDGFDLLDAKRWVAGVKGFTMAEVATLTEHQRRQLDPTLDFLTAPGVTSNCPTEWTAGTPCPSPKDTQFLQYVFANFQRFVGLEDQSELAALITLPDTLNGELTAAVSVFDRQGTPAGPNATKVLFELTLAGLNLELQVSVGNIVGTTDDGLLVAAVYNVSNGVFQLRASGPEANNGSFVPQEDVEVVLVVRTYDSFGATSAERAFAFAGSSVVGTPFTPLTTVDIGDEAAWASTPSPVAMHATDTPLPPPPAPLHHQSQSHQPSLPAANADIIPYHHPQST
ncbi:hypothetical protein CYMTET_10534 [Cymbomonas tetramitiformis]|uniref:GPS domain-containing protein n=1 Tax=Cymbomonas tetramitiformis TaxID=36881 RepID=A0AAE0LE30_9CHLO|nr:hypothetical protein CYMTET_10534 [Cymbomonas tetramitiformis]